MPYYTLFRLTNTPYFLLTGRREFANIPSSCEERTSGLHAKKVVMSTVSQQEFKPEDLPDLNCQEVAKAAVQIQKVYRGFQTRKQIKQSNEAMADDLPDLKSKDVADAAVKIQAVYR